MHIEIALSSVGTALYPGHDIDASWKNYMDIVIAEVAKAHDATITAEWSPGYNDVCVDGVYSLELTAEVEAITQKLQTHSEWKVADRSWRRSGIEGHMSHYPMILRHDTFEAPDYLSYHINQTLNTLRVPDVTKFIATIEGKRHPFKIYRYDDKSGIE